MFDPRRFLRLARVQWAEQGRAYLWFLGIGVAVHLCALLLETTAGKGFEQYSIDAQQATFIAGYMITGPLFAMRYFAVLSERDSALTWLMRPASTLEKFLLAFLVVAVLYPLAYTLAFQICNLPGAWMAENARDAKLLAGQGGSEFLKARGYGPYLPFTRPDWTLAEIQFCVINLTIQALVLAGGVLFRKFAWLKTLVALFVLMLLVIPLLALVFDATPEMLLWSSKSSPDSPYFTSWLTVLWIGIPALLWSSVFHLLRERDLR